MTAFIVSFLLGIAMTSSIRQERSLREEILKILEHIEGTCAVAFENLQTGRQILINEREMFHAASTMKTPVMIEVFKNIKEGGWSLQDSLELKNEFRSIVDGSLFAMDLKDDSDDSMYKRIGQHVTLRELVVQMITVSSNLATNILIDRVGANNVTESMRALGADSILVLRGVEDQKAYERGLNNKTNAYDLLLIYKSIAGHSAVDGSACEQMLDILDDQKFRDIIPALLPEGTRVAHKTGSINGVEHDSGVVFLPDGRSYVLVLLSKEGTSAKETKAGLAQVSRIVYDYMAGQGK